MSLRALLQALLTGSSTAEKRVIALFPGNHSIFTDSGRSALGAVIEACGLQNTRMAVPAFLCTNILPVLEAYNIEPVFIDTQKDTYQSDNASYTGTFKSALVVATYGTLPDTALITGLEARGVRVIEDYAHVPLPITPETLTRPRTYSLAKTLPVPDGGIAVLPENLTLGQTLERASSGLKNILKTWHTFAVVVFWVRRLLSHEEKTPPHWAGVRSMSNITRRLLARALETRRARGYEASFTYCHPFSVENPMRAQKKLFKNGIIAERIWHPTIAEVYSADTAKRFPNAQRHSVATICAPLWHINARDEHERYINNLEHILAGELAR